MAITGVEFSRKAATGSHVTSYRQLRVKDLLKVPAKGGVEPATFRTEGTKHHHSTKHAPKGRIALC